MSEPIELNLDAINASEEKVDSIDTKNFTVRGALANVDRTVEKIRSMDAGDAKILITEIRAQSTHITNLENIVKLISGFEIGDKAMKSIEEELPHEYVEARAHGLIAHSKVVESDKVDPKTGLKMTRIVWYCKDLTTVRKALTDAKSPLRAEGAEHVGKKDSAEMMLNNYDLRRHNMGMRKTAMKQILTAVKVVKCEEIKAIHIAKKTPKINLYELGRLMIPIDAQKVVVSEMIATPAK